MRGPGLTRRPQELVKLNQHLLNALGAGHESIDRVLDIASSAGHAGKLTGAGGGGCVIVHLPKGKSTRVEQQLKQGMSLDRVVGRGNGRVEGEAEDEQPAALAAVIWRTRRCRPCPVTRRRRRLRAVTARATGTWGCP